MKTNIIHFPYSLQNLTYEQLMLKANQILLDKTIDEQTYKIFMREYTRRLEIENEKVREGIRRLLNEN